MEQDPIKFEAILEAVERKCAYMLSLPGNKITGFDYVTTGSADTAYYSVTDGRIGLTEKLTTNLYKALTNIQAEQALEAALTHEAVHSLATKYMFDPKEIVSYENFIFQRLEDCRINQISISLQPNLIPAFENLYKVLLSARPPTPEDTGKEAAMFKKPTGLQLHRLISQISEHSYEPNFALKTYVIRDQMKLDKEAYDVSEIIIPKIVKLAAMHPDPFDPTYTNNISLQSLLAIRSVITDIAPHILLDEMKQLEKEMREQKRPSIKDLIKELEDEIKRREPPAPPQPTKQEPDQKKDQTQPEKSEPKDQTKSPDKQDSQPKDKDTAEKKQPDAKSKDKEKSESKDKEQGDQGEPGEENNPAEDQGESNPSDSGASPSQDGKPSDPKQPGQKADKPSQSDKPGQPGSGKDGKPTQEPSDTPSPSDPKSSKKDQSSEEQGAPSDGAKTPSKADQPPTPKPEQAKGDKQHGSKPEPSKDGVKDEPSKTEATQEKPEGQASGKDPAPAETPMPATSPLPSIKDLTTDQLKQLKEALEKMQEEDMPGQSSIGEDGKDTPENATAKSEKELKALPDPTKPSASPFPGSSGYSTAQAKPPTETTQMVGAAEYSAFISKYYPTVAAASRLFSNMDDREDQSGPARIKSSTQGPLLHTKNIAKFTSQGPTGELPPFFKAPNSSLAKGRRMWKLEKMFISIDGSSSMSARVPFVKDLLGITYEAARKAGIPVASTVAYDGQPTILSKGTFSDKPSEVIMKMLAISVRGGTNISEGSLKSLVENKGRTVPKGGRLIMLTDCETSEEDLTLIGRYAKELDYPALIISVGDSSYSAQAARIFQRSDNCTIRANYQDKKALSPESSFFKVFSQWMKDPDHFKRQYGHYADTESPATLKNKSSYER